VASLHPLHIVIFLFGIGIVTRLMTDPNFPGLIDSFAKWLGNLFSGSINS
jgi:hypothetical protein